MRVILSILLIVNVLSVVGVPASAQQSDDICATVIDPAIEQSGLDPQQSAPVFGCEQTERGVWAMRTVSDTRGENLPETFGAEEFAILELVDTMSLDHAFRSGVWFDRSTPTLYSLGAGGSVNTTDLSDQAVGSAPNWLNNYVGIYTQSMQTFLTRTAGQNPELIEYMEWLTARRDATIQTMAAYMNPTASSAFRANWGYQLFPWFWQLSDPVAIAAYFDENPPSDTSAPAGTTSGAELTLTPDKTVARPGDTVTVALEYPRLQGIHSVAFMYYAEQMFALNVPRYLLDSSGDLACSVGSEGDPVQPIQRATDLATAVDVPPSYLELEIDASAQDGDRLSVCVELVGFALDREVFVWNARIDITVVE